VSRRPALFLIATSSPLGYSKGSFTGPPVLNQDTLLLVQVSITLLTTALLIAAAFYTDSPQEQRLWALGNLLSCAGMAATALRGAPPIVDQVLSYGALGLGLGLVLRGLRLFCMEELAWRWVALIAIGAMLLTAYFALIEPDLRARLIVSGIYFALLNWACAYTLARHGNWRAAAVAVFGFTALGVALFLRGAYLLLHPGEVGPDNVLINATLFVVAQAQVCIAFGLILLVSQRYAERLRHLSALDHLTGALNRLGLEVQGQRVMQRAMRSHRSVTVMMVDVDYFKQINDNHGHPAGDEVLRQLARLLKAELRPLDLMARYGGEEFVLVLDGLESGEAVKVAERLRATVEQQAMQVDGHAIRYTVSVGVVGAVDAGYDLMRLIAFGDAAMYEAKRGGRNRVVAYAPPTPDT